MKYDCVVVGAGLAGSVIAERLANVGKTVLVIEQRDHIGGNCYDYIDENGILVHKYGPHAFHTNSKEVWDYLSRFTNWNDYKHKVTANVDGKIVMLPVNMETISQLFSEKQANLYKDKLLKAFKPGSKLFVTELLEHSEQDIQALAKIIYEKIYLNYSKKQWGVDPKELDPMVLKRVPLWLDYEPYYFKDKYQGMPIDGFTKMIEKILNKPRIEVLLSKDYKDIIEELKYEQLIYTGSIDYFFDYKYGKLPYRSLRFEFEALDEVFHQQTAVVNYPGIEEYTRTTEFKRFYGQSGNGTIILREYPDVYEHGKNVPSYAVPKDENYKLYSKYKAEAEKLKNIAFIGRLAEYKYYNMDEAIGKALSICHENIK